MGKRTFEKGLAAGAALVLAAVARVGRAGSARSTGRPMRAPCLPARSSPAAAIRALASPLLAPQGGRPVSRARNTNIRKSYFGNAEALFPGK
jgi:hypothetical protein